MSSKNLVLDHTIFSSLDDLNFEPQLNFVFAIDKNYLKPCGILIFSILKNNPTIKFDFHIFTNFFDDFGFNELLKSYPNFRLHVYKINTSYFDELQTTGHFTTAIYYRLSIAEILKNKVDTYLYLDSDILCFSKVDELININLENYILAAVEDIHIREDYIENLGLPKNTQYFNSGVLFINTKKWLESNILEKFKEKINLRDYKYPDQDVLNILLLDKVLLINEKFNYFNEGNIKPIFKHFVSTPKPWSICVSNNDDYLEYYYQSPWKNLPLDAPRNGKEAKKFAIKLFYLKKYAESVKWFIVYLKEKFN